MRLYITGIKNMEDAKEAVSLGASAVGIKIGYGENAIHPEIAREIYFSLPVFISRVGIFADEKRYNVQELVTFCRLDTLHFIGSEEPEDLKRYPEHVLKSFHENNLHRIKDYNLQGIVINLPSDNPQGLNLGDLKGNLRDSSLILSGSLSTNKWVDAVKKHHPFALQLDLNADQEMICSLLSIT